MKSIDIHSHLQFTDFDSDRDQILADMITADQGTIVVGTNFETSRLAIELAIKHDNIWATIGHHPVDDSEFKLLHLKELCKNGTRQHLSKSKIVAVGECGFDFFRVDHEVDYQRQELIFKQQLDLAIELQLPLMLHGRPTRGTMNAYQDILDLISQRRDKMCEHAGNAHFFVGDLDIAKQFLDLNFTLSFDGPITFARDYDEVIRYVPADMIHAETDAPYAAPAPHRGQQNSPLHVSHVIDSLIKIRDERNAGHFKEQLVANATRVFSLDI